MDNQPKIAKNWTPALNLTGNYLFVFENVTMISDDPVVDPGVLSACDVVGVFLAL